MQKNIKYRSDIDGLRALAVLSVLIFHFNDAWLPGGFLGVDIFFVISGYLITSIIKRQITEGRFSYKDFYTRRIKRILPLFFVVLFVTFIASVFILLPEDYENFWRSARYAMQFRANRAFTGFDYFKVSVDDKPLLHLWSLAIEEQFYFIWPTVFLIAFFLVKRMKTPLTWIFWLSIVMIIASTITAEFSIYNDPGDSYYLLQNRAAELLVGCALALNPYRVSDALKKWLGILGAVVVVICIIVYDSNVPFPGVYALIPTIAAALFILDDTGFFYKKLFTNRIARTIGLWSFSLYLWHWPILALIRYMHYGETIPVSWMIFAALLTVGLSIMTYYLVENPVRRTKFGFVKSLILIYLIPMGLMTFFNSFVKFEDDFITKDKTRWFNEQEGCWQTINESCAVGDVDSKTRYLLIGDSHAMHYSGLVDKIGKAENISIDVIAGPGCPVYFGYNQFDEALKQCLGVNQYLEDHWQEYDAILLSNWYERHLLVDSEDPLGDYRDGIHRTVKTISETTPILFISDIPEYTYNPLRAAWLDRQKIFGFVTELKPHLDLHIEANQMMKEITDQYQNAGFVNVMPYIDEMVAHKEIIFRDQGHLNPYGSYLVGDYFIQEQNLKEQVQAAKERTPEEKMHKVDSDSKVDESKSR